MFIGNGHNKYCSWVGVAKKVVCIGKREGFKVRVNSGFVYR